MPEVVYGYPRVTSTRRTVCFDSRDRCYGRTGAVVSTHLDDVVHRGVDRDAVELLIGPIDRLAHGTPTATIDAVLPAARPGRVKADEIERAHHEVPRLVPRQLGDVRGCAIQPTPEGNDIERVGRRRLHPVS